MENKLKIGIAHGDINGISYELIIKMMADNKLCEVCTPVLYGSSKVAAYYRKMLNVENFNLNSVQTAKEANPKRCNVVNCVDDEVKVEPGQETPESDEAAMLALNTALDALDGGELAAVVAAPVGIRAFHLQKAEGCTELLTNRYDARQATPLLVGNHLKVGFMTMHLPLHEVASHISLNSVLTKLKTLDHTLRRDFTIRKPRIAVLGLNPRTGGQEQGETEKEALVPAIAKARENGILAFGPYHADTFFTGMDYQKFDVVLAMYHDQGMIPFKTLEGNEGAVLVAGLPVVYTSSVSGTAFDIAGQGTGDETGLRNALYLAMDVYAPRKENTALASNPLQHYNVEGNANESDLNVDQIAGIRHQSED